MHCKELVKGKKWVCIADGPKDPVTGKRNQISRRGRTKAIATQKVLDEIDRQTNHGINNKLVKNITFNQLAKMWIEEYRLTGVKNATVDGRESEIKLLSSYIGEMQISKISLHDYQSLLNDLFKKEYARSSLRNYNACANMIFNYAVRNKMLTDNPIKESFIPKKVLTVEEIERDKTPEKFFERDELERFLLGTTKYGLLYDMEFFHIGAFGGLRPGEICALKWTDINFELNTIRITKTIYSKTNNMRKYELTPPKTYDSIREITMDQGVMDMMKDMKARQEIVKAKYSKEAGYHDANFVFCRDNGYPYLVGFFVTRMKIIMRKTGIDKHATPHLLRHTHVSMLTEAGADLPYIMDRVGHKDGKTTREVYTHVSKKMKKTISENMHDKFGDIVSKSLSERNER